MIHNEERSYLIERDPEMIQMVELVDKDIKNSSGKFIACV